MRGGGRVVSSSTIPLFSYFPFACVCSVLACTGGMTANQNKEIKLRTWSCIEARVQSDVFQIERSEAIEGRDKLNH
jgi:hypothetical protein